MRRLFFPSFAVVAFLATAGLPAPAAAQGRMHFETATAWVIGARDSVQLRVEVAESSEQRGRGLQFREHLADDAGMIFIYTAEQDSSMGYWMWQTRIPLDAAYLAEDGRIVSIHAMTPCGDEMAKCRPVPSGAPFWRVLEVNRGWFERHGFAVGDRVRLEGWPR